MSICHLMLVVFLSYSRKSDILLGIIYKYQYSSFGLFFYFYFYFFFFYLIEDYRQVSILDPSIGKRSLSIHDVSENSYCTCCRKLLHFYKEGSFAKPSSAFSIFVWNNDVWYSTHIIATILIKNVFFDQEL